MHVFVGAKRSCVTAGVSTDVDGPLWLASVWARWTEVQLDRRAKDVDNTAMTCIRMMNVDVLRPAANDPVRATMPREKSTSSNPSSLSCLPPLAPDEAPKSPPARICAPREPSVGLCNPCCFPACSISCHDRRLCAVCCCNVTGCRAIAADTYVLGWRRQPCRWGWSGTRASRLRSCGAAGCAQPWKASRAAGVRGAWHASLYT